MRAEDTDLLRSERGNTALEIIVVTSKGDDLQGFSSFT